jgi:Protein of unknown function (DUF4058)
MPIHDWSRVDPGTFHNFHFLWIASVTNRLNKGILPPGYFAMAEQIIGRPETDVVTLQRSRPGQTDNDLPGGVAIEEAPPKTQFVMPAEQERYTRKKHRVAIRHRLGHVAAVIEIVSPGNKDSKHALRSFAEKAADLIRQGVNLLVIDLFPPTARDPNGIHPQVWDEIEERHFELPEGKPLTLASYMAEPIKTAFVQPIAVGESMPAMPLFLSPGRYVNVPLESTYQETWGELPSEIRMVLDPSSAS